MAKKKTYSPQQTEKELKEGQDAMAAPTTVEKPAPTPIQKVNENKSNKDFSMSANAQQLQNGGGMVGNIEGGLDEQLLGALRAAWPPPKQFDDEPMGTTTAMPEEEQNKAKEHTMEGEGNGTAASTPGTAPSSQASASFSTPKATMVGHVDMTPLQKEMEEYGKTMLMRCKHPVMPL